MSGFDKAILIEKLKELGWKECSNMSYDLIPPDKLFDNAKGIPIYVYDARDVQNLLGEEVKD
jgi:hypothetical protein